MSVAGAPPILTKSYHSDSLSRPHAIGPLRSVRPLRETARCSIVIGHPQEIIRAGLASILGRQEENEILGETPDGRDAVRLAHDLHADVVILSLSLRSLCGIDAMRQILREAPYRRVIVIASTVDELDPRLVNDVLKAGASAFLLHDSAAVELALALRAAQEEKTYLSPGIGQLVMDQILHDRSADDASAAVCLTPKQREVLRFLAEGATNKQIASSLYVSIKTVETHRADIMKKLNIHSVAGLTKYAIRKGISSLDS